MPPKEIRKANRYKKAVGRKEIRDLTTDELLTTLNYYQAPSSQELSRAKLERLEWYPKNLTTDVRLSLPKRSLRIVYRNFNGSVDGERVVDVSKPSEQQVQ
jgi:hypothetical protein